MEDFKDSSNAGSVVIDSGREQGENNLRVVIGNASTWHGVMVNLKGEAEICTETISTCGECVDISVDFTEPTEIDGDVIIDNITCNTE
jgi:hypothetical protein